MKVLLTIFLLNSSILFARGPAVEPIFGISVENRLAVNPSLAKGFDWSSQKSDPDIGTLEKSNLEELILLLILLVSLPLIFFIFLNLNKKGQQKTEDSIEEKEAS